MKKSFIRSAGLLVAILFGFVSVFYTRVDAAPSNSTVTTHYVLVSDLSAEEQQGLVKEAPNLSILHDKEEIKLVYNDIPNNPDPKPTPPSTPTTPTKLATNTVNKTVNTGSNLPKAGESKNYVTVGLLGGFLILLAVSLLIWKRKQFKTMLALLILAGGTGLAVVAEASDKVLPKSTTQLLPIGETTYTVETDLPGFEYVGYVHTYSADGPVQEEGTVTVNYQTIDGVSLDEPVILNGLVGDNYVAEKKAIEGYVFKEVTGNVSGTFTEGNQVVTFIYEKEIEDGSLTIKYQDMTGNPLVEDELLTGKVGEGYLFEPKAIDGYIFKEVTGSVSGTFTKEDQVVTFIYEKEVEEGRLIIKYQDLVGNPIMEDDILTGKVGEEYLVEPKAIDGYFFFSTSDNTSGIFVLEDQVITLVYSFDPPQFGLIILRQTGVILIPDSNIYYKVTYYDLNGNVMDQVPNKIEETMTIYDYVRGAFIGGPYTVYATVTYEAYSKLDEQRVERLDYKLEANNPSLTKGVLAITGLEITYTFTGPNFG